MTTVAVANTVASTDAIVKTMDRRLYDQEHYIILDWLTSIDYSSHQSDFIGRRQEGTGEWLLQSNEFKDWINQNKRTLFCPGIPGVGKTIAASIVVDHLQRKFQDEAGIGIAYLYCNFQQQQEQNPKDLLLSLLKQLSQSSIPETVITLYRCHKTKGTRPSFDEISNILHTVVAGYSRTFIIVDALDECRISDRVRDEFMLKIFSLQARANANIFATSRPIPDITAAFEKRGDTILKISASHEDLQRYLDGHMLLLPSSVLKAHGIKRKIKNAIIKAANGM
jgi:Cdc6-like AAA superfamily ATPase